jgi:peptide/nickel transport system substrate-binding protein
MKKYIIGATIGLLLLIAMVLPSCTTTTATTTSLNPTTTATMSTSAPPATTPATQSNWWDKFGEPAYGGEIIIREGDLTGMSWDPSSPFGSFYTQFPVETMFQADWAVDRKLWAFQYGFTPIEYMTGAVAQKWEQTDPVTWTVQIRQGIKFQNKPPVNGRELTAADVQYSYDWLLGTGSGFTEPNIFWPSAVASIQRVVATDKYTVQYKLKAPSAAAIFQIMEAAIMRPWPIVAHEWVEQGNTTKWENMVGTGPFLLTDFVEGSSLTFNKNPTYWGHDERHPKNQLPYADTVKSVAIPDMASSVAAIRTGKVDLMVQTRGGMTWQQGESLKKSNPEIELAWYPNPGYSLDMMCDTKPFTDVRVRQALNMAIDRPTLAKVHYGGYVDGVPCGVTAPVYEGFCLPYKEWPADLQKGYSYDPAGGKALLAEAGYPNGFQTNCLVSSSDDTQLLQIFKDEFKDIGVDMAINAVDGVTFRGMTGKADQMVFTNGTAMPFGPDWCIRFRESTNTRDNFTRNNDATYDGLIRKYDVALTLDEAKKISIEADQYLLKQYWAVQSFPGVIPFAWQPYIKGYSGENVIGGYGLVHVPTRLWVDQAQKKSLGR